MNDLKHIDKYLKKEFDKNSNVTFSGLFRRHRMKVPLVDDYPILAHISAFLGGLGRRIKPNELYTALRYSREYQRLAVGEGKQYWTKGIIDKNRQAYKDYLQNK